VNVPGVCTKCNGSKTIVAKICDGFGVDITCDRCDGTGREPEEGEDSEA